MIYELRTYTVSEEKMDVLVERFRKYTLSFFKKYNICVLAFWCNKNRDKLVYLALFEDEEQRNIAWKTFLADEEWKKISAITNRQGRLVLHIDSLLLYSIEELTENEVSKLLHNN